jgi:hypothetical protein
MRRLASPPKEVAEKYAAKEYIFLNEVAYLANIPLDEAELILQQGKLRTYPFMTRDHKAVHGYLTFMVKKVLAARGRIIPGFNEDAATHRQWVEMIDSALERPLDPDWYFPPVNPDPLVIISDESAQKILDEVKGSLELGGSPAEILRLVADLVNMGAKDALTNKKFNF